MIPIRESTDGLTFSVRVHPRANDACIEFFAKLLKVPQASVSIAAGLTSRNKTVRVAGLSGDELQRRLGLSS